MSRILQEKQLNGKTRYSSKYFKTEWEKEIRLNAQKIRFLEHAKDFFKFGKDQKDLDILIRYYQNINKKYEMMLKRIKD